MVLEPHRTDFSHLREYERQIVTEDQIVHDAFRDIGGISVDFSKMWCNPGVIVSECKQVLFRLTGKTDGSLIPLWVLLDDWPRTLVGGGSPWFVDLKLRAHAVIRQVLWWACKKAKPPVSYDRERAVFTKTPETLKSSRAGE